MGNNFLLGLIVFSASSILVMVLGRVLAIRQGREIKTDRVSLGIFLQELADYGAYCLVKFSVACWTKLWLFCLNLLSQILSLLRRLVTKIERRFVQVATEAKQQGAKNKKGSLVILGKKLENHRDNISQALWHW